MRLALIVENKSMRHSLGRRVGGGCWEIFQSPHDPFDSICVNSVAITSSLLSLLHSPFLLSFFRMHVFSPSLIFGSDGSDIGTNASPDASDGAGLKAIVSSLTLQL